MIVVPRGHGGGLFKPPRGGKFSEAAYLRTSALPENREVGWGKLGAQLGVWPSDLSRFKRQIADRSGLPRSHELLCAIFSLQQQTSQVAVQP